jgi:hypothetical protein
MDFLAFLAASEAYPVGTAAVTIVRLLLPRLIPQRTPAFFVVLGRYIPIMSKHSYYRKQPDPITGINTVTQNFILCGSGST